MGKYLAIKTANFSEVAVNQVTPTPIEIEVELTPTIISGLAVANGTITPSSTRQFILYYVPIVNGKTYHLQIEWSAPHMMRVGTTSVTPALGVEANMLIEDTTQEYPQGRTTLDYTYVATLNGYLVWNMHITDNVSCEIIES